MLLFTSKPERQIYRSTLVKIMYNRIAKSSLRRRERPKISLPGGLALLVLLFDPELQVVHLVQMVLVDRVILEVLVVHRFLVFRVALVHHVRLAVLSHRTHLVDPEVQVLRVGRLIQVVLPRLLVQMGPEVQVVLHNRNKLVCS